MNESVPTSAIIASGIHSPGLRAHVAHRGAQLAAARGTGAAVAQRGRVHARERDEHRDEGERVERRSTAPTPTKAMTAPALAGPTIRALWTMTEFSETALTTRSAPTSSMTKLWRVGLSIALTAPRAKTSAQTISGVDRARGGEREERERGQRHERLGDHEQRAAWAGGRRAARPRRRRAGSARTAGRR